MEIRLGVIGQGGTGKTELIRALQMMLMQNMIDPGPDLEFGPVNHQSAKEERANFEQHEAEVAKASPSRTVEARDFEYALKQGGNIVCKFVYHDAIGQLLDTPDLDQTGLNQETAFIEKIALSNVLWVVIPIRIRFGEIMVDDSKVDLVKNYISEAIKFRNKKRISSKISLAIVMTRSDLIGSELSKETLDAIGEASEKIIKKFKNFVEKNDIIWSSVLYPVSAFGFGNSIEEKISTAQNNGSQGYYLAGPTYEPWNLSKLLLWSLCAAVHQPTGGLLRRHSGPNSDLASNLSEALGGTAGPALPLKLGSYA